VDGDAPLTQAQVDSVWRHLPTTGASWVDRGNLLVQQFEGAKAFNLGPVERGVKGASDKVRFGGHSTKRHHATKKLPAQLQREIDEVLASPGSSSYEEARTALENKRGSVKRGESLRAGHAKKVAVYEKGQRVSVLDERGHEIGRGHVYSGDNYPASNERTTWVKMTKHGETVTEEWPTRRVVALSRYG
jgi:hypothetical protein